MTLPSRLITRILDPAGHPASATRRCRKEVSAANVTVDVPELLVVVVVRPRPDWYAGIEAAGVDAVPPSEFDESEGAPPTSSTSQTTVPSSRIARMLDPAAHSPMTRCWRGPLWTCETNALPVLPVGVVVATGDATTDVVVESVITPIAPPSVVAEGIGEQMTAPLEVMA